MRKGTLRTLCAFILCLLFCVPLSVSAAALDSSTDCSLTLHYTAEKHGLSGLEISVYRVGEVFEDGTYRLLPDYAKYPVDIQNLSVKSEWQDAAFTLRAYLSEDHVKPFKTVTTDTAGAAVFTKLPAGLYLIGGLSCETETGIFHFADSFMFLPYTENGVPTYQVDAKPKFSQFTPHDIETRPETDYSVIKLWKDNGHTEKRPQSIEVTLYKDGSFYQTVTLSDENNWCYTWLSPIGHNWTVTEPHPPKNYTVSVSARGSTFVLTNTLRPDDSTIPDDERPEEDTPEEDIPQTGDTSPLLLYILLLTVSGLLLIVFGIAAFRRKNHEKKN